jgi:hypothetical protein
MLQHSGFTALASISAGYAWNRDRLLEGEIAAKFLRAVLAQREVKALLSDEHFSVDGTLHRGAHGRM